MGVSVNSATTPGVQTTMVTFSGLNKGTEYSVRVRGVNEAGPGIASAPASAQTPVDRKSTCTNLWICGRVILRV